MRKISPSVATASAGFSRRRKRTATKTCRAARAVITAKPASATQNRPDNTAERFAAYASRTVAPPSSVRLYAGGSSSSVIRSVAWRYTAITLGGGGPAG